LGFSALRRAMLLNAVDPNEMSGMITDLMSWQLKNQSDPKDNHSWNKNVYDTSLALRALKDNQLIPMPDPPDLRVTAISITPQAPTTADLVNIVVETKNVGGQKANNVLVRLTDLTPNSRFSTKEKTYAVMEAGQTAEWEVSLNLSEGAYSFLAEADPDQTVYESDDANNTAGATLSVAEADSGSLSDLEILSSEITLSPENPDANTKMTVQITIRNKGNQTVSPVPLVIKDLADSQIVYDPNQTIDRLASGESKTIQVRASFSAGVHNLRFTLDPENVILESDETNNIASKAFEISSTTHLPDLSVSPEDLKFSNDHPKNEPVNIEVTVHNLGNAGGDQVYVEFFDGNPFEGGTQIGVVQYSPTLAGGASQTFKIQNVTFSGGPHKIFVFCDRYHLISESNEANNMAFSYVWSGNTELPDLAVDQLTMVPEMPVAWQKSQVTAVITNTGTQDAQNVTVNFYKGNPAQGGFLFATQTGISVAKQNSVSVQGEWYAVEGQNYIYAVVDPYAAAAEENELNNTKSLAVTVTPGIGPVQNYKYYVTKEFERLDVFRGVRHVNIARMVATQNDTYVTIDKKDPVQQDWVTVLQKTLAQGEKWEPGEEMLLNLDRGCTYTTFGLAAGTRIRSNIALTVTQYDNDVDD